ncbi:MAG: hypothetical protein ACI36T_06895 [Eggerthellaceae bacterium]
MSEKRVIGQIDLDCLDDAWDFFVRHSGVSRDSMNPKYEKAVYEGKRLIDEICSIGVVCERVGIDSIEGDSVSLSTGQVLTGRMVARALADASELYAFVITLNGFSAFVSDDILTEYFGDTWGTSYVESAQALLAEKVSARLAEEGMKRTHIWCPGQTQFEIANQRVLFDLLSPQDIGCTLSSHLMMQPVKSASGVMGVISPDVEEMLKPCDYCTFKKSCPASKKGCACL